ncbi:hypothetical protein ACQYWQ_24280 [Streptomyces sp. P6-2-1]|uniref:hypothetical protein n=1 Tax=Streptomyces sp. P6-2-1 TaxID=3422591 RepID=UPI003D360654
MSNSTASRPRQAVSASSDKPASAARFSGMAPRQKPRLIEIIQNLRERIREARANGRLGEVEGLQVSFDAAMAKFESLKDVPTGGRPQLVDLGRPCSLTTHHRLSQMSRGFFFLAR